MKGYLYTKISMMPPPPSQVLVGQLVPLFYKSKHNIYQWQYRKEHLMYNWDRIAKTLLILNMWKTTQYVGLNYCSYHLLTFVIRINNNKLNVINFINNKQIKPWWSVLIKIFMIIKYTYNGTFFFIADNYCLCQRKENVWQLK